MITWAICWMVVKLGGASEGIGTLLLLAMLADAGIVGGICCCVAEIFKKG